MTKTSKAAPGRRGRLLFPHELKDAGVVRHQHYYEYSIGAEYGAATTDAAMGLAAASWLFAQRELFQATLKAHPNVFEGVDDFSFWLFDTARAANALLGTKRAAR
jgi:hypothetical protein